MARFVGSDDRYGETALEPRFTSQILCGVLGYRSHPAPAGVKATIYPKPSSKITGIKRVPDAALGDFMDSNIRFATAVELKSPGTDLDVPQPGHGYETPVEQGFYYGKHILGMRWVVVSDMRIIRLYSVESEDEYEEIVSPIALTKMEPYPRVQATGIPAALRLPGAWREGIPGGDAVRQVSGAADRDPGELLRGLLPDTHRPVRGDQEGLKIVGAVPQRQELLEATQRLLDRLLFVYYCEDHPQQLIKKGTLENVASPPATFPDLPLRGCTIT